MSTRRAAAGRCGKPAASEGGEIFSEGNHWRKKGKRVRKSGIPRIFRGDSLERRLLHEEFLTESVKESFSATEEGRISIEVAFSLAEKGGLLLAVIFEIEEFLTERRGDPGGRKP